MDVALRVLDVSSAADPCIAGIAVSEGAAGQRCLGQCVTVCNRCRREVQDVRRAHCWPSQQVTRAARNQRDVPQSRCRNTCVGAPRGVLHRGRGACVQLLVLV